MLISTTPQSVGTGSSVVIVSVSENLITDGMFLQYGFGTTAPSVWHNFYPAKNAVLNVGTDVGMLWLKTPMATVDVNVTVAA